MLDPTQVLGVICITAAIAFQIGLVVGKIREQRRVWTEIQRLKEHMKTLHNDTHVIARPDIYDQERKV
jgi:hypothetical protein